MSYKNTWPESDGFSWVFSWLRGSRVGGLAGKFGMFILALDFLLLLGF